MIKMWYILFALKQGLSKYFRNEKDNNPNLLLMMAIWIRVISMEGGRGWLSHLTIFNNFNPPPPPLNSSPSSTFNSIQHVLKLPGDIQELGLNIIVLSSNPLTPPHPPPDHDPHHHQQTVHRHHLPSHHYHHIATRLTTRTILKHDMRLEKREHTFLLRCRRWVFSICGARNYFVRLLVITVRLLCAYRTRENLLR